MSQIPNDPSTSSEFTVPTDPPAWPKVIGIISIVLSSFSLICGGCGVGMLAFMHPLLKMAEPQMGPAPSVMFPGPGVIAIGLVGVAWASVLLMGGITTVKRRPAGRSLHLVWAGVAVLLTIVSTYINWKYQSDLLAWAKANPSDKWAKQQNPTGAYVGMGFGICLGFCYPIFLLVWFGMIGKKPEAGAAIEEPLV